MTKRILIFILIFASVMGVFLLASKPSEAPANPTNSGLFENISKQLPKEENLPGPLAKLEQIATGKSISEQLSSNAIITLTNQERTKLGRTALKYNRLLSKAAEIKLNDMFERQYFEHISPDGKGPADVVTEAGYKYILVGENLAEGDFRTNAELLDGWMNSPGHRANILNPKYTEIGVAAKKGVYQGKTVWMAVQEFGKPSSECPQIDEQLKAQILTNETQIKIAQSELAKLNAEMLSKQQRGDTAGYNTAVGPYNALVNQTNALISQTKAIVSMYNTQVQSYNACIE